MTALFVDTGAFYAVADGADRHHSEARDYFRAIAGHRELVTTDYVFVESWCLIRARLGTKAALRFWDNMNSGVVTLTGILGIDRSRARRIISEWPDQGFSLVDAASFAFMERHGLEEAFAFDAHFTVFRAGPGRDQAFRIVP